MVSSITISPNAAEITGCTASFSLEEYYVGPSENPYLHAGEWYKNWRFTATPSSGWYFLKWEITTDYVETFPGGNSRTETTTFTPPPDYCDCEEYYYDYSLDGLYGISSATITKAVAIFTRLGTGKILRFATSGNIIRGASGAILRDE